MMDLKNKLKKEKFEKNWLKFDMLLFLIAAILLLIIIFTSCNQVNNSIPDCTPPNVPIKELTVTETATIINTTLSLKVEDLRSNIKEITIYGLVKNSNQQDFSTLYEKHIYNVNALKYEEIISIQYDNTIFTIGENQVKYEIIVEDIYNNISNRFKSNIATINK